MIRIRDKEGKPIEGVEPFFVEVCSVDGKVVRVLMQDGEGRTLYLKPGDRQFDHYLQVMHVEAAEEIKIE